MCSSTAATSGVPVTIFARSQGQTQFHVFTTVTSGPGGTFALTPQTITSDVWFYAVALGHRSGTKAVRLAPQVTLVGPAEGTQIKTGKANAVTFTGTVSPVPPSDTRQENLRIVEDDDGRRSIYVEGVIAHHCIDHSYE